MGSVNLLVGWTMILASFVVGGYIGTRAQDEQWLGGYASVPRRLVRLGHIALAALGILNVIVWILFSVALASSPVSGTQSSVALHSQPAPLVALSQLPETYRMAISLLFAVGGILMPIICFLSAMDFRWRCLFAIPVTLLIVGSGWILLILI